MKIGRPINSQTDFFQDFKGTDMGALKLDEILDFVQYSPICGKNFSVAGCYTVRGKKKEPRLQVVIDHDNGYVKKAIYLGDNFCSQKCYSEIWKNFVAAKLEEPVAIDVQTIITLNENFAPVTNYVEA